MVHALDDVATLAEGAQGRLGFVIDDPLAGPDLIGEAKRFEFSQATDLLNRERVRLMLGVWGKIDDAGVLTVADELPIKLGPALGPDLPFEITANVEIGPRPEFLRHEIACAVPHPLPDVIAGDHEILAVIGTAAQDDMDMGIVGVPVIHRDPVQRRAKILLHPGHQVAGEGFEIGHVDGVLGRDDEPEMVPIVGAAFGEILDIGIVGSGTEHASVLAVTGYTFASQIGEVSGERRGARGMADNTSLDDRDAGAAGQQAIGLDAGDPASPELRSFAGADPPRAGDAASCLLRRRQRLRDEGPRGLCPRRTDPPRTNAELALIGHRAIPQCGKGDADTESWVFGAHCAERRQCAGRGEKPSKYNRPTDVQCARFYLAIVRSFCRIPASAPSTTRGNTRRCEWGRARSW